MHLQADKAASGDDDGSAEKSESEEQWLIRTKRITPGEPNYLRTLRLSASHEVGSPRHQKALTCLAALENLASLVGQMQPDHGWSWCRLASCMNHVNDSRSRHPLLLGCFCAGSQEERTPIPKEEKVCS